MKVFTSVVLIFVGIVWTLFWLLITNDPSYFLTSITNGHSYPGSFETRILQAICFLVAMMAIVPFRFGFARLITPSDAQGEHSPLDER
jgi:hypothetical protein